MTASADVVSESNLHYAIFRESRTMLISTHYMDEAEALADQIVIISKGSLKCSGSTSFLKNNLGDGYHLALRKEFI